jgi:hypothetical protein
MSLPACAAIIHLVGNLYTRGRQFQEFLPGGSVGGARRELSIMFGLLAIIVGVVHARPAVQCPANITAGGPALGQDF